MQSVVQLPFQIRRLGIHRIFSSPNTSWGILLNLTIPADFLKYDIDSHADSHRKVPQPEEPVDLRKIPKYFMIIIINP